MNPDGTGIKAFPVGVEPAWSPDGTQLATVLPFDGACPADGRICPDSICITSSPTEITTGNRPAWALSMRPVAWFLSGACNGFVCTFDGAGSWGGDGGIVSYSWDFGDGTTGSGPAPSHAYPCDRGVCGHAHGYGCGRRDGHSDGQRRRRSWNQWPTASFTYDCNGSQCTFNGAGSGDGDGAIASYDWFFGDGDGATGSAVSHRYTAAGAFTVTLIVTDNGGATGRQQQTVTIAAVANTPPVASFTFACSDLTCTFNAAGSSDQDGTIASYAWNFGDGATGSGATPSRTMYAAAGSYTVALTVTDNSGATNTQARGVTAVAPRMHVGDLDRASTSQQSKWTATVTITVHDMGHGPVAGTAISGSWNNGATGSCTTNASGQCPVSRSGIAKNTNSASFTVTSIVRSPFTYIAGGNHDPDGDSNGTTITVTRP